MENFSIFRRFHEKSSIFFRSYAINVDFLFSAIDVDAAVCIAAESDQVDDVVDLVYRLRHTKNTSDFFESTSYALIRLLLKFGEYEKLFKVINDPVSV